MFRKLIGLGLVVAILAVGAMEAQAIKIRSTEQESGDLKVSFEPTKPIYRVGESIRFRVKANKDVYLYVFGINRESNTAYVLLPNDLEKERKYAAWKKHLIPGRDLEFIADKPGLEELVAVASTKRIDLDTGRYRKDEGYYYSHPEEMEKDIKAIRTRNKNKAEQVSLELKLTVVGRSAASAPAGLEVATYVSTDRQEYRVGDPMKITFGADEKGYIYLYYFEPGGEKVFLKKQAVDGVRHYQVKAEATAPIGRHRLVAVYNRAGDMDDKAAESVNFSEEFKGITLIEDKPAPYAVYYLTITD